MLLLLHGDEEFLHFLMYFSGGRGERSDERSKGHISPNITANHPSTRLYFTPLSMVSGDERRMTGADIEV